MTLNAIGKPKYSNLSTAEKRNQIRDSFMSLTGPKFQEKCLSSTDELLLGTAFTAYTSFYRK